MTITDMLDRGAEGDHFTNFLSAIITTCVSCFIFSSCLHFQSHLSQTHLSNVDLIHWGKKPWSWSAFISVKSSGLFSGDWRYRAAQTCWTIFIYLCNKRTLFNAFLRYFYGASASLSHYPAPYFLYYHGTIGTHHRNVIHVIRIVFICNYISINICSHKVGASVYLIFHYSYTVR